MKRETRLGLILSFFATAVTLIGLEFACRVRDYLYLKDPIFSVENRFDRTFRLMADACATVWDPELGWTASIKKSDKENRFGTRVTVGSAGFRSNGHVRDVSDRPKILAAGDSLTFGDNVSDHESWPAYLEELVPYQVLNAGVCAYGMDQAYLRARKYIQQYNPEILIYSTAISGVNRSAWSAYEGFHRAPKPYFEVIDDKLVIKNQPVPSAVEGMTLEWPHRVLGYSTLASKVMNRAAPKYWHKPFERESVLESGQDGDAVACKIMERLKADAIREKRRTIVLIQYWWKTPQEDRDRLAKLMKCVDRNVLELVDLGPTLDRIRAQDPAEHDSLYLGHMSAKGNKWVATLLRDQVSTKGKRSALP